MAEVVATKRFCRYLELRYPKIISLLGLTRDIMESYLIYLQTEAKERKNYRSDLYGLRRVIEDVGNHYDRQDIKNLFISTDFPSSAAGNTNFGYAYTKNRLFEYKRKSIFYTNRAGKINYI